MSFQVRCEQEGMAPLNLDTKAEETYFLDLVAKNNELPTDCYMSTGGTVENGILVWKPSNSSINYEMNWDWEGSKNEDHEAGRYLCLGVLRKDDGTGAKMEQFSCVDGLRPFLCQKAEVKSG